jgi:hypothetical protein
MLGLANIAFGSLGCVMSNGNMILNSSIELENMEESSHVLALSQNIPERLKKGVRNLSG